MYQELEILSYCKKEKAIPYKINQEWRKRILSALSVNWTDPYILNNQIQFTEELQEKEQAFRRPILKDFSFLKEGIKASLNRERISKVGVNHQTHHSWTEVQLESCISAISEIEFMKCKEWVDRTREERLLWKKAHQIECSLKKYGIDYHSHIEDPNKTDHTFLRLREKFNQLKPGQDLPTIPLPIKSIHPRLDKMIQCIYLDLIMEMKTNQISLLLDESPNFIRYSRWCLKSGRLNRMLHAKYFFAESNFPKYPQHHKEHLLQYVRCLNGECRLSDLQNYYSLVFSQKPPSRSTLYRLLSSNGITYKKTGYSPIERNTSRNQKRRLIYYYNFVKSLIEERLTISIDETSFNYHDSMPFHYAVKGERWSYQGGPKRVQNITCILAVSQRGPIQSMYVKGQVNSAIFAYYLMNLFKNHPAFRNDRNTMKPLIVMDNCSYHHTIAIRGITSYYNVECLYTPAYSPFCNPVEYINRYVKEKLKQNGFTKYRTII